MGPISRLLAPGGLTRSLAPTLIHLGWQGTSSNKEEMAPPDLLGVRHRFVVTTSEIDTDPQPAC